MSFASSAEGSLKRQWAGPAGADPARLSSRWGRGNFPLGNVLPSWVRRSPPRLAARGVQTTHAGVGAAEQTLDAPTKRSNRHNGDNSDEANEQRVLHHGGTTLGPCALKQVGVEATHREERVQKQLSHFFYPSPSPTVPSFCPKSIWSSHRYS